MSTLCFPKLPNKSFISASVAMALSFSVVNTASAGLVEQHVTFQTTGQSMWNLGESTEINETLFFGAQWGDKYGEDAISGKIFDVGTATQGNNGISVSGETNGKVGLEVGFLLNSGTVNASLPLSVIFDLPDAADLRNGQAFSMGVQSAKLEAGAFLDTISPAFETYADLIIKADAAINVKGCYDVLLDSDCGSERLQVLNLDESFELLSINRDNNGEVNVLKDFQPFLDAASATASLVKVSQVDDPNGPPGQKTEKVSLNIKPKINIGSPPLVEVNVRLPDIKTETRLASDKSLNNGSLDNVLQTSGEDNFIDVDIDVDQIGTIIGVLPPLGVVADVDFGVGNVSGALDLLDLTLTPSLSLTQDFSLSIKEIDVRYVFDEAVNAGLSDSSMSSVTELSANNLTDDIFVEWTDNKNIGITTLYDIAVEFINDTGLKLAADFTIDILKGSIAGEVFGIDMGSSKFGPLLTETFDLGETAPLSIFKERFDLGGFDQQKGNKYLLSTENVTARPGRGNWNDASTWEGGIPFVNDVTINRTTPSNELYPDAVFVTDNAQSRSININGTSKLDIANGGELSVGGDSINLETELSLLKVHENGVLKLADGIQVTGLGQISLLDNATLTSLDSGRASAGFDGVRLATRGNATIRDIDLQFSNSEREAIANFDGELTINHASIAGDGESYIVNAGNFNTSIAFNSASLENINLGAGKFRIGSEINNQCLNRPNANICYNTGNTNTLTWKAGESGELALLGQLDVVSQDNLGRFPITKTLVLDGQEEGNVLINNGLIRVAGLDVDGEPNFFSGLAKTGILQVNKDFTFAGNGSIVLSNSGVGGNEGSLRGASGVNLVNGSEHSIIGSGTANDIRDLNIQGFASIDNQGNIFASQGSLRLNNNGIIINNGNLGAESGGYLRNISWLTNNGRVYAADGGVFSNAGILTNFAVKANHDTSTLTGGLWEASNGGSISIRPSLPDSVTTFSNQANIILDGATSAITAGKSLDEFQIFSNHQDGTLSLKNGASFNSSSFQNFGEVNLANATLKGLENNVGGLVQGYGNIELSSALGANSSQYVNNGMIRAQDGILRLSASASGSFINKGAVEVMGGARLIYNLDTPATDQLTSGHVFNGSGGTWAAYADDKAASLEFFQLGIPGFSQGIKTLTNGEFILSGEKANFISSYFNFLDAKLQKVDLQQSLQTIDTSAKLSLANGQNFAAQQPLTNKGKISLNDATLSGALLINNGNIGGNGALKTGLIVNNGLITASDGELSMQATIDNTNGIIATANTLGNILRLDNARVFSGALNVAEQGQVTGSGALTDVTLANQGRIVADGKQIDMNVAAGSSNSGIIEATNNAIMSMSGEALTNDGGLVSINQASQMSLEGITIINGAIEVIGNGSVLSGYGTLDNIALQVSEGMITANVDGQRLTIDPAGAAQLLRATLQAENGGILLLSNGEFDNGGGTLIQAKNGSVVELQNVAMNGGRLETVGSGKIIEMGSSTYRDMSINANVEVANGASFNVDGTILNSGSLVALDGGEINMSNAQLSSLTLQRITMPDGTIGLQKTFTDGALTIEKGGMLKGSGRVDELALENQGTIHANGDSALIFDLKGDLFVNNGKIDVTGAGGMQIMDDEVLNNGVVNVASTFTVENEFTQKEGELNVDGELMASTVTIEKGSLAGNGLVNSDVVVKEEGRINRGSLILMKDLYLSGTLEVDMRDQGMFNTLEVKGSVFFDMTTKLEFIFDSTFSSFADYTFDFLIADNFVDFDLVDFANFSVVGLADGIDWNIDWDGLSDGLSFVLTNNGPTADVAEPSVLFLFMSGFIFVAVRRKKLIKSVD